MQQPGRLSGGGHLCQHGTCYQKSGEVGGRRNVGEKGQQDWEMAFEQAQKVRPGRADELGGK